MRCLCFISLETHLLFSQASLVQITGPLNSLVVQLFPFMQETHGQTDPPQLRDHNLYTCICMYI